MACESLRLLFPAVQAKLLLTGDHPTDRHGLGLNHGFLDDVVVTSFGVVNRSRSRRVALVLTHSSSREQYDYGSAYIDILARDMLSDHEICTGFGGFKL